ncbi:MAG: hypothetical protein WC894_00375 [Patescibacteria group bacterium]
MAEKKKQTPEDLALIEWKKAQVSSNIEKFQLAVVGEHGNLQVSASNEVKSINDGTNTPSVTLGITSKNPNNNVRQYEDEKNGLAKSVDRKSRKFGATSEDFWQFTKNEGLSSFEKIYRFELAITRSDRFFFHAQKGKYGQALLGFVMNK